MNIHTVQTKEEANKLLKEHKTNTFVYALVVDDEMVVLGEGTGDRKNVIFPGHKAPGHQKAAIAPAGPQYFRMYVLEPGRLFADQLSALIAL